MTGRKVPNILVLPGNTYWRARHSTVDLLLKVACFVKRSIKFSIEKEADLNLLYKEVNGTDPSPSVRIPWPNNSERRSCSIKKMNVPVCCVLCVCVNPTLVSPEIWGEMPHLKRKIKLNNKNANIFNSKIFFLFILFNKWSH